MKKINFSGLFFVFIAVVLSSTSQLAFAQNCSGDRTYECGGACYFDAAQAHRAGCSDVDPDEINPPGTTESEACPTVGRVVSGCRTSDTQDWCDTNCVTYIGNGNDGCMNAEGIFVSRACVCADPENALQSMIDIELNLGIDIDDEFLAVSDYVGQPPSINTRISYADALKYFQALLGDADGRRFTDILNPDGNDYITRNEASAAKGADPTQTLGTSFGCGLSTDDILAYIGLYMGDGSIDKYQGNLHSSVKDNLLKFTRTWQPGTDVLACQYRGGCDGSQTPRPRPTSKPTPPPTVGDAVVFQAEAGELLGDARIYDDGAASGGKGVAHIATSGSGLMFDNLPAANSIDVTFASMNSGKISVRVNGRNAGDIQFSSTGAWVGSYASSSLDVDIPSGASLEIFFDGGDAAMNVDYISVHTIDDLSTLEPTLRPTPLPTVRPTPIFTSTPRSTPTPIVTNPPVSSGDPVVFEAESGERSGSAGVYDDGAASGGQAVAYLNEQDAGFLLTGVPAAYSIEIAYASQRAGKISLKVNGIDAGDIRFQATGNWVGGYSKLSHNVDIPPNSTLEIYFDRGDAAMNVDYITVNSVDDYPTPTPTPTPAPIDTPTPDPIGTQMPIPSADYYYITHKPSGSRLQTCEESIGTRVVSAPKSAAWHCVQWEKIGNGNNGEYFLLKNRYSGLHLFPQSGTAGSNLLLQPNTWKGNWATWSYEETGDGYGYIVNRGTGLLIFLSGEGGAPQAQPTSWSGDYTRWQFEPAE